MPNYRTHLIGGFVIYCILILGTQVWSNYILSITLLAQWLVSCLLGSLFPDIDTKSKIQRIFYVVLLGIFILLTAHGNTKVFIAASFLGLIPLLVNHRTIFHRPLFLCALALTIAAILTKYNTISSFLAFSNACFFIAGALSHIWLDMGLKRMLRI